MKTNMAALLLVLALALVSAPLTAEAKKKKGGGGGAVETPAENSFCGTFCHGRKGVDYVVCKEGCDLNQRANLVGYSRVQCTGKCTEQKGITKEGMVVCQDKCEKDYKVKAAEVTAACNKLCVKEKQPTLREGCLKGCTPP